MLSPALRRAANIALLLLICFGLSFRFLNLNWDEGAHLHPDERFLTMTVPELAWPTSPKEYFHTETAPLNPFNHKVDFFIYGQFPLMLTKAVAENLASPTGQPNRDNYNDILLVGRCLSALFDSLTLLMIFLIGRRLLGTETGLLAAALLALIPLHIQQAHFFVVDTFATFFIVASFWALCRTYGHYSKARLLHWLNLLLAGLFFGAAASCKISSLLFGAVILLWTLLASRKIDPQIKGWLLLNGIFMFFVAFWTFRILNPIAFRGDGGAITLFGLFDIYPAQAVFNDNGKAVSFWQSFAEQAAISRGEIDPPWNWQWFGRTDYLWPLRNLALWAVGWPILLTGCAGAFLVMKQSIKEKNTHLPLFIAALWCLIVFGYYGGQYSKFSRYYLAMTPFLSLLAAWSLLRLTQHFRKTWTFVIVGALPLLSLAWSTATTSIYTRPHTRLEATRWIWNNVPSGTMVATETDWDDRLPIGDVRGIEQNDLDLYNHDTLEKRAKLIDTLDRVEWIFVSSNRVWGTVTLVPQRWPMTNEYYRALFNGELGFALEKNFTSYPQLFGYEFPDDNVEEALTVYDHPHVMLFRKTPQWSRQRAETILDEKLCEKPDLRPLKDWLHPPKTP